MSIVELKRIPASLHFGLYFDASIFVGYSKGRFDFSRLLICIKYFRDRNHEVVALLPRYVQGLINDCERKVMDDLEKEHILCFTPSRRIPGGRSYVSYDDR